MRATAILLCFFAVGLHAQAPAPDAEEVLKGAITEQQQGDYQAAIRDYRKVLELRPEMMEAKVNLGAALSHAGQYDEAIAMYESALPSLSFKNPVLINLGLAYYKKGDFAHARTQFEAVHRLEPNNGRVVILLADTDLRLNKSDEVVALMGPLDPANATDPDFQFIFGSALISTGHRRDGAARVEQIARAGNRADAFLLAGATFLQLNEFEKARNDLEAALRLDSTLPNIYTLVGTARDKTGDPKAAEPAFREALKLNPDNFDANLYLGAILYKRRELAEAKTYLDRALKLDPANPLARFESAMLKSTTGENEVAAQELEKLVKENPDWLDPHVQLATLYYKLHRPEDGARERQIVDRLTAEQQKRGPGG